MATTADQLMAPALVSASNGLQSNLKLNTNTNLNSNEEDQAAAAAGTDTNNKSSSPKPSAMNSLKLHKMGSVSSKEKRVYKIVLTGGKWTVYSLSKLFFCISAKHVKVARTPIYFRGVVFSPAHFTHVFFFFCSNDASRIRNWLYL